MFPYRKVHKMVLNSMQIITSKNVKGMSIEMINV